LKERRGGRFFAGGKDRISRQKERSGNGKEREALL